MKVTDGNKTIEVTEKAYNVVYSQRGYKPVEDESLEDKTVKELKEMADDQGIEGYSNMKKAELIEALEG